MQDGRHAPRKLMRHRRWCPSRGAAATPLAVVRERTIERATAQPGAAYVHSLLHQAAAAAEAAGHWPSHVLMRLMFIISAAATETGERGDVAAVNTDARFCGRRCQLRPHHHHQSKDFLHNAHGSPPPTTAISSRQSVLQSKPHPQHSTCTTDCTVLWTTTKFGEIIILCHSSAYVWNSLSLSLSLMND